MLPHAPCMRFERALLEARACGVPRIDVLDDNPKLASLLEGPILSHDFYAQQLRLGLRCALCLARGTDRHHHGCERGDDGVDGVDGHHSEGDSCPSCPARGSRRYSSRSSGAPQTADADGPCDSARGGLGGGGSQATEARLINTQHQLRLKHSSLAANFKQRSVAPTGSDSHPAFGQ